jgi:hypothetical protein
MGANPPTIAFFWMGFSVLSQGFGLKRACEYGRFAKWLGQTVRGEFLSD